MLRIWTKTHRPSYTVFHGLGTLSLDIQPLTSTSLLFQNPLRDVIQKASKQQLSNITLYNFLYGTKSTSTYASCRASSSTTIRIYSMVHYIMNREQFRFISFSNFHVLDVKYYHAAAQSFVTSKHEMKVKLLDTAR